MKTTLRLVALLLIMAGFGGPAAYAATAPTLITNPITNATIPRGNGLTVLVTSVTATLFNDADGNTNLASYRITTLPTSGQLYAYNVSSGESVAITSTTQTFVPFEYPSLAYDPAATAAAATYSFQYQATDEENLTSPIGTYNIPVSTATGVNQLPLTREVTNVVIAKGFAATTLEPGLFGVDPDGSVQSYIITSIPSTTTVGVLRIGTAGAQIAAGNTITAAQAAQLTFDPVATYFGTAIIQYQAVDNTGASDASAANYAIPVSNAGSPMGSALLFYSRPNLEDWTSTSRSITVNGTTVSVSGYTGSDPETNLIIEDNPTMPGRALTWTADYVNNSPQASRTASVSFAFSKPVSGFTMSLGDIDLSGTAWTDQVTVIGKRANGTTVVLAATDIDLGTVVTYTGNNVLTGNASSSTADDNTVITFPEPIVSLTLTYANLTTIANPAQQLMTIESFAWYTPDVVTTLTGPARANPNTTVAYVATIANNGPYAAATVTPTVQLIAGLTNVTINGAAAGTAYNSTSGLLTLPTTTSLASGTSLTYNIGYTIGTTTVTGIARNGSTSSDEVPTNNNGSLSNAQVTTTVNQAPVVQNITAPTMPNTNPATAIPALIGTDPDGDNTITSYVLTNIPATTAGVLTYTRNGTTVTLAAANGSTLANRTLTPAEMATLQFDPAATFVGNATFNYSATDDLALTSNTATYTIPVATALGATDLFVSQQVQLGPYKIGDLVTFTVMAGNTGAAATGVQVKDALPAGLSFVSATISQGSYDNTTGVWTIVSGATTFASGASATLNITARITKNGTFTNTSIITASTADTNPFNNEASQQVNPGTAAYVQDFEGRTTTDYCEVYTGMSLNTSANALSDNNSLVSNAVLSTTPVTYATPLLRFTGSGSVSFLTRVSATTNTSAYRVALLDANNNRTILTAFTAFANTTATTITANVTQSGVYRVEVSFASAANGATNGLAYLDDVVINNVSIATQANDGSNCATNVLPVANDVTTRIANSAGATTIPSLSGSDTAPGVVDSYVFQTVLDPITQGSLTLNGVLVKIGQIITVAEAATLKFAPVAGYVGTASFQYSVYDNSGEISLLPATYSISVENATTIAGRVFDDVNYGGGAGRSYIDANTSAKASGFADNSIQRGNAIVELYDKATDKIIATTTTSGTEGSYSFANVLGGNYVVRVVNASVTSVRNATASGVLAVQTYVNGDVNRVGGEDPLKTDAGPNTGTQLLADLTTTTQTPQSITTVVISTETLTPATNVDFGFNFDVISNTNSAGQGSLAQFILNSNALPNSNFTGNTGATLAQESKVTASPLTAGRETSIFMISNGTTVGNGFRSGINGGFVGNTATISLTSALPDITASNTTLDGFRQSLATGNNVAAVTTGANVTTGAEVIVNFNSLKGLLVTGGNTTISSLEFDNAKGTSTATTGTIADGAAITLSGAGVTGSVVRDVTAKSNATAGVFLTSGATGVTVANNVLRDALATVAATGITATDGDGIRLNGAVTNTITANVIYNNAGFGLELTGATSSTNTVSSNTIDANGGGGTSNNAGISIQAGNNNLFRQNIISNSVAGDGIVALNGTSGNRFSQNSMFINGDLGIDLTNGTTATGDGTTLNANGKTSASGANGLLNFPVITQVAQDGTNLRITGYAPANALVEFFVADVTTAGFGEGRTFLGARTEGLSTEDVDTKYSDYSGTINGVNSGSETLANRFAFSIPFSSLTAAQISALTSANARVTATATALATVNGLVVGNTSEYSGNAAVLGGVLPVELTKFTAQAVQNDGQLSWATASEKNNDYFAVERSFDGATFTQVGKVAGSGTSSQARSYTFTDSGVGSKHSGSVYYRLQQVDTNGATSYSAVRVVSFTTTANATVSLYPNPASAAATLDLTALPAGSYAVTVIDLAGRILSTRSYEAGAQYQLDLQALPQGLYQVSVRGQNLSISKPLSKK
ncbi:T9SS type A sorting domain-containing protein [Hymenobacter chitinivorans]|uniref:Parallel beta-helix repeat protein n=1 Tax=Hymenobacter chitinivorans DSM 11115 TaxID=1121954 RepID=A0A2M9B4V6_9BACT|nr:T9SS type A sorting domain-containing protein [Hymenobacter chitinivorans]PJJ52974.1 parallel beta-helix repeat protein [Hymenobacter chitinivorans DSM 11115]